MDFLGKRLVHTPEGVRDIYGEEYACKLHIEHLIHQKLNAYGYQDLQTPSFEFFDVFGHDIGTTPSKELYKFFDKEGNTLVLRPDFTPSIARCAAKYFMDETIPLRFCYLGNNYINNNNLQGKLKESTQMGAELVGDKSAQADAEMIAMLVETLLNAGLKDFQVSIGQIDYFRGLCEEAALSQEVEDALRDLISNRNMFGAEELLLGISNDEMIQPILHISELFGSVEILNKALSYANNDKSKKAIYRLQEVYELLQLYGVEKYITFDLAMVNKYNYYTGVIFSAYTYQSGSEIAKGGRYDNLLEKFGKPSAAIGFVVMIDDLLSCMKRQDICPKPDNKNVLVLYQDDYEKALKTVSDYRKNHFSATLMKMEKSIEDYQKFANDHYYSDICVIEE